ncbi:MAG: phosphoglycerate dehydrogenase [Burkholderiales bacterium]
MTAKRFEILVLNNIAAVGLQRLPAQGYHVGKDTKAPDAVLVRSADMHAMQIPASVRAIGRAGVGTNNIPIGAMSARGVPVFNAPGANANAVKELVVSGMLIAARNLVPALQFVASLRGQAWESDALDERVEAGKKEFAGMELPGRTLGVIGLGKIGSLVADAGIRLGMNVLGHDPQITVEAAWSLPSQVRRADSIDQVLRESDFISLHVPLNDATRGLIDERALTEMRSGAVLLNFSRDAVVDEPAVVEALTDGKLRCYVTDFPSPALIAERGVIALPHLGASTQEAEDNCAIMVADQVRDYLEHGIVRNAVNFPDVVMARESPFRVAIANSNVPNMLGQISTAMANAGLNIHNMINKSKGEMAYTLVDCDSDVPASAIEALENIRGVLAVRYLPAHSG